MVRVIDPADKAQRLLLMLDQLGDEGLIAMSDVEVTRHVHQKGVRSQ
jgi:hypothetical protein